MFGIVRVFLVAILFESISTKPEPKLPARSMLPSYPNGYRRGEIIFPDGPEDQRTRPVPRISDPPMCAGGDTFCETSHTYPYHLVKDILRREVVQESFFFGRDEVPFEVEKRLDAEEETVLCSSVSRVVFPKVGKTKDNVWKYIVNQGQHEEYVQGVRVETCKSQGDPCNILGDIPLGYRLICKQKYTYRRLLSLNEDGKFVADTFQLPSSCCCSIETSFASRIEFAPRI